MKWKDAQGIQGQVEKEKYFDEEQYSPWAKGKDSTRFRKLDRNSIVFVLLGLAIVTSVAALLMLLLNNRNHGPDAGQLALLQERLAKYEAIDEKVTRIWEQAKSFEKFKDSFDRGESPMSLRLDHLSMSLEKVQKQLGEVVQSRPAPTAGAVLQPAKPLRGQRLYHTVAAGDTFYNIGKRYNIEVENLLKMNGLGKDSLLKIGQKLMVRSGLDQ
ncbi:MAG: LysM domain-containing protein [Desulfobacteraceae bacterium]|nr:MAG: LysM domain-containing protein [Desulfobacteraceae bacterium]